MTWSQRHVLTLTIATVLGAASAACTRSMAGASGRVDTVVASMRSEPESFNPYTARPDVASDLLNRLLHAPLVRINRTIDELEPWLAESITAEADGRTFTVRLRQGVTFSDGTLLSPADVVASFAAATHADSYFSHVLKIEGEPIEVAVADSDTVTVRLPAPYGPGLRILADVPIIPASRVRDLGRLRELWPSTTAPADLVGVGPFVLGAYEPGQRLVLNRNARYWRRDEAGHSLPYLERLVLEIVGTQDSEILRLIAGQTDVLATEVRAEDLSVLRRAERSGRVRIVDLGPGLDANALWFNLRPSSDEAVRPWLRTDAFRQAVAHVIDRRAFVDTIYLGAAEPLHGPISPANQHWYSSSTPRYAFDPARARQLLAGVGLRDRDGDGLLEDAAGRAAAFVVLTQAGHTQRERGAALIREQLRSVGLAVETAALEPGTLFEWFARGNYDAMYFGLRASSTDPAGQLDFWLSSGHFHLWHPRQAAPQRRWEAQIDQLMARQVASSDRAERKRLFDEIQRVFGEHVPAIFFAAPHVYVATSTRMRNAKPVVLQPQILWHADTLAIHPGGAP